MGGVEGAKDYISGVVRLSRSTFVWPDPEEQLHYGSKASMIAQLDKIAVHATLTPRPLTEHISVGAPLEENIVIKRGFSAWTERVTILPQENRKSWNEITKGSHPAFEDMWLKQTYEPLLRMAGEARVFFIDGTLRFTVHTCPKPDAADARKPGNPGLISELVTGLTPRRLIQ